MIFLDNASTTKMHPEVIAEMNEINSINYYNPSSLYKQGVSLSTLIDNKRKELISMLGGASSDSLVFTSGATEANNFALRGALKKNGKLLVSKAEHPSVYNLAKQLQLEGYNVDFVNLAQNGLVDEQDLFNKLEGTTVVSLIHVCNETGAINDIKTLVKKIKSYNKNIIVHSDGVQAFGKVASNVTSLGVDLYTISAHKIHGPKGVGALFVKNGVKLKPFIYGGEQENNLRAGTQNVSGICGLTEAAKVTLSHLEESYHNAVALKTHLVGRLSEFSRVVLTTQEGYSPYIITLSVPKLKSEILLHLLEEKGILIGNGSACSSKHSDNRILSSMGLSNELVNSSVRISLSFHNTIAEMNEFVDALKAVVNEYFNKIK